MANAKFGRQMASASATARHLSCDRQYPDKLVALAAIERGADGKYDLDETRRKYITHLREQRKLSPRTVADVGYQTARADLIRLRIAEKQGQLIPADVHERRVEDFAGVVLTALGSLPAKIGGTDLGLRRRIERAVLEVRREIAMAANAKGDAEGEPPLSEQGPEARPT